MVELRNMVNNEQLKTEKQSKSKLWIIVNIYGYIIGVNIIFIIISQFTVSKKLTIITDGISLILLIIASFFAIKLGVESTLKKTSINLKDIPKISFLIGIVPITLELILSSYIIYINLSRFSVLSFYLIPTLLSSFIIGLMAGIFYGLVTYFWLKKLSKKETLKLSQKNINIKISTPIAIGIILILTILVGGFTLWQYNQFQKETTQFSEIKTPEKKIETQNTSTSETVDLETYINDDIGFTMELPKGCREYISGGHSPSAHPELGARTVIACPTEKGEVSFSIDLVDSSYFSSVEDYISTSYEDRIYPVDKLVINGVEKDVYKLRDGEPYFFVFLNKNENWGNEPILNISFHSEYFIFTTKALSTFKFIEKDETADLEKEFPITISPKEIYFSFMPEEQIPKELQGIINKKEEELNPSFPGYTVYSLDLDSNQVTEEYVAFFQDTHQFTSVYIYQKKDEKFNLVFEGGGWAVFIEKEKTNGYNNIINAAESSNGSDIFRYKWDSTNNKYSEDKEWNDRWGGEWSENEVAKFIGSYRSINEKSIIIR